MKFIVGEIVVVCFESGDIEQVMVYLLYWNDVNEVFFDVEDGVNIIRFGLVMILFEDDGIYVFVGGIIFSFIFVGFIQQGGE